MNSKFVSTTRLPLLARLNARPPAARAQKGTGYRVTFTWHLAVAVLCLAYMSIPLLSYYGHDVKSLWPLFVIWAFLLLLDRSTDWAQIFALFRRQQFPLLMLCCWIAIILLNTLLGRGYSGDQHLYSTITTITVLLMAMYYSSRPDASYRVLAIAVICFQGFESLRALPQLLAGSNLARAIVADPSLVLTAAKQGIHGYESYTVLAILLPCLVAWALTARGMSRVLLIIACTGIALSIVFATYTAAFFLMIGGLVIYMLCTLTTSRHRFVFLGIVLGLALVIGFLWTAFVQSNTQVQFVVNKAQKLAMGVSSSGVVEGDESGRGKRFMASLDTFLEHPLVGVGPITGKDNPLLYVNGGIIGGHATWVDQSAEYGILGFGFYIAFIIASAWIVVKDYHRSRSTLNMARIISTLLFVITGFIDPVLIGGTGIAIFSYFFIFGFTPFTREQRPTATAGGSPAALLNARRMRGVPEAG